MLELAVASAAFTLGTAIPADYTCVGQNISPEISWDEVPAETESIALIADDPDALGGCWVHWVLFNIPPGRSSLPANIPATPELPDGSKQGVNSFRRIGYGGPCPPPGAPHRYFFKVYALKKKLDLKPGVTSETVEDAMRGSILALGTAMGTFKR